MAAALSALVEIICVERIANVLSMVLYIYGSLRPLAQKGSSPWNNSRCHAHNMLRGVPDK